MPSPLLVHVAAAKTDEERKLRLAHSALFHRDQLQTEAEEGLDDDDEERADLAQDAFMAAQQPHLHRQMIWDLARTG